MSKLRRTAALAVMVAGLSQFSVAAEQPAEVPWNKVCAYADQRELQFTTTGGEPVRGYCVALDATAISVRTKDGRELKVLKTAIAKLEIQQAKGHQVQTLGRGFHKALKTQVNWLLSPLAPAGVVAIPLTLAWGAVALPFCAVGDMRSKVAGHREIKPI